MNKYVKHTKQKSTDDDWYPTLKGDLVEVTMSLYAPSSTGGYWHRVCVWGGDDYGWEKDYQESQQENAREMFEDLCAMPKVNVATLRAREFVPA